MKKKLGLAHYKEIDNLRYKWVSDENKILK